MMRLSLIPALALLAACVPEIAPKTEAPKGPAIEIVEAARAADTTRVVLRYKDGGAIPEADTGRAMLKGMEIACQEGETAIPDTTARASGLLTVNIFCVGVTQTDEVIDGSRLKT